MRRIDGNMVTPVPNLNGNSGSSLVAQCRTILDSLRELEENIARASDLWHGRNFQTMNAYGDWQRKAQLAWDERRQWLHEFQGEIMQMAIDIQRLDGR